MKAKASRTRGVQVHIVSAVVMHPGAALGALQQVAGFCGDLAGGEVAGGVLKVEPVETCLVQGPDGEC